MKIFEMISLLKKNSDDEDMGNFLRNLLQYELKQNTKWKQYYEKSINEYYDKINDEEFP